MWGKILKDKERLFEKNVLDVFSGSTTMITTTVTTRVMNVTLIRKALDDDRKAPTDQDGYTSNASSKENNFCVTNENRAVYDSFESHARCKNHY